VKHSHELIEHVRSESDVYITDIWYHEGFKTYSSILTDTIDNETFETLDDIRSRILTIHKEGIT
jgi:hypothetical protein